MEDAAQDQALARGAFRLHLQLGPLLALAPAADDQFADLGGRDEHRLLRKFEADPVPLDPAHIALRAIAVLEANLDLLAEPGFDPGVDHHAVGGDVDDVDLVALAAEGDDRALDKVQMPVFATLVVAPRFLAGDRDCGEARRLALVVAG